MEIERSRRVAGADRDSPQTRALQPLLRENLLGGIKNEISLVSADRLAPALPLFDHLSLRIRLDKKF